MIVFFISRFQPTPSIVIYFLKLVEKKRRRHTHRLWIHTNVPFSFSFSHQNYNYFSSLLLPDDHEMYFLYNFSFILVAVCCCCCCCCCLFSLHFYFAVQQAARTLLCSARLICKSQESYCTNFILYFCISAKFNELLCGIGISKKSERCDTIFFLSLLCFHIAFRFIWERHKWTDQNYKLCIYGKWEHKKMYRNKIAKHTQNMMHIHEIIEQSNWMHLDQWPSWKCGKEIVTIICAKTLLFSRHYIENAFDFIIGCNFALQVNGRAAKIRKKKHIEFKIV